MRSKLRWSSGVRMRAIFVGTVVGTFINSFALLPVALAQMVKLGVVQSPDNAGQWSEITQRLQATGIDYCVIDFSQVQQVSDLGSIQLLFLPNIQSIEPVQMAALQEWMRQGGRTIASGPAGALSQPEIRNQLRSLLGAYWGFALTKPSALEPLKTNAQMWVQQAGRASNMQGGVVIPSSLNSSTAAVWSQNDNPPAVVTTNQSTFFGWRWGINVAAPPEVDTAWLRAAVARYNLAPTKPGPAPAGSQRYCVPAQALTAKKPATLPSNPPLRNVGLPSQPVRGVRLPPGTLAQTDPDANPDVGVAPAQVSPNKTGTLTATQVAVMSQDLENLLGRFESALLAANAMNSNVESQTGAAVQQFLVASAKGTTGSDEPEALAQTTAINSANRVAAEARSKLQGFRDAIAQRDYDAARQQWTQARRLLWDNYPTDRRLAQPEIRAIWLDRGTIVRAKSVEGLTKIFDQLAAAGFNTVFIETVNASYPIYPSRVAPEQNPLTRGWDPLAAAVKLAHERGMELHAWVWAFAAANQRHNAILNQPANYPGPVLKAHPDWAMFDRQGHLFASDTKKAFLDPANPEARRYLLALIEEIATRYDVDGIQLDYIRYPFQDSQGKQSYGYGQAARQIFKEQTGYDPIKVYPSNRELWQKWTNFRVQQIDSFVATVAQRLRSQRPNLILSAAVFPLPRAERVQRLQQNWEDWAIRGDIDLMVPMTYAVDSRALQTLAQPSLSDSALGSALILPAIRLLNMPTITAVDQIQLLRDLPAGGYALFAVENLDATLSSVFARTQGRSTQTSSEPIPYRQPFPAAAARYAALQREWSYLLANHRVSIQESELSEWGKQADILAKLLDSLVKEPSTQNVLSTKAFLSSFRSQFQRWMRNQAVEQPYQVRVWDNRLATIERLLRYGERTTLNPNRPNVSQSRLLRNN
ncbi:MAG TPA: family 10 glycosylhydrolase [Chroococcales cyanobacterium]